MTTSESWKPAGYQQVVPCLAIPKAKAALEFYKTAFGAQVMDSMLDKTGEMVMHASLRVYDTVVFVSDPFPEMGYPVSVFAAFLYVPDADSAFKRAVDAGATAKEQPSDKFWGDRTGKVVDPFGLVWTFSTKIATLDKEDIVKAAKKWEEDHSTTSGS